MKQQFKISLLALSFVLVSIVAFAQQEDITISHRIPKWVSEKGYWVVEGNIHNKLERTIHFYNNNDQLVYRETVTGKFNLRKRKTLMHMKKVLDTVVVAWEQKRPVNENLFASASR